MSFSTRCWQQHPTLDPFGQLRSVVLIPLQNQCRYPLWLAFMSKTGACATPANCMHLFELYYYTIISPVLARPWREFTRVQCFVMLHTHFRCVGKNMDPSATNVVSQTRLGRSCNEAAIYLPVAVLRIIRSKSRRALEITHLHIVDTRYRISSSPHGCKT